MKFAKVMFLHMSVCPRGQGSGIPACLAGGNPACLAGLQGGVCVSQHALQVSRPTPKGELEGSDWGGAPGPHPRVGLQAHTWGCLQAHTQVGGVSQHVLRLTRHLTANAAGGTHPTGMHSYLKINALNVRK